MDDKLYHYTTAAALIGIINEQKLWLSDFRYLNDKEEMIFAKRLVLNAANCVDVEEYLRRLKDGGISAKVITEFRIRYDEFLSGKMGLAFLAPSGYLTTVFSLSEEFDSLAQWRAYGNQEICIEFRKSYFERLGTNQNIVFKKAEYFDLDDKVPVLIDKIRDTLDGQVNGALISRNETFQFGVDLGPFEALFIKHRGFSTENEWRLVWRTLASTAPHLTDNYFLRASGRYPVPTAKMPINITETIAGVIFGPGADHGIVSHFRSLFNGTMPMHRWDVRASTIPYRV